MMRSLLICCLLALLSTPASYGQRADSMVIIYLHGSLAGEAGSIEVLNGAHEMLPVTAVQQIIGDWYGGEDGRGRCVSAPPQFMSVDGALAAHSQ